MESEKDVKKWYNTYSKNQLKIGVNLRHYHIVSELMKNGMKNNHTVLEIGCGIGTLTGLLNRALKKGKLVAADISNESIEIAKTRIKNSERIDFVVTDMTDFQYDKKFDFIVLPDVMEHIPLEQHDSLFKIMANHMHEDSVIFINIPHPNALDYMRKHMPEKLQIIDQSIGADIIMNNAYKHGLRLCKYEAYSLFSKETDYATITFILDNPISHTPLSQVTIIKKKQMARARFLTGLLK